MLIVPKVAEFIIKLSVAPVVVHGIVPKFRFESYINASASILEL